MDLPWASYIDLPNVYWITSKEEPPKDKGKRIPLWDRVKAFYYNGSFALGNLA